jgi:hypothetical protein
MRIPAVVVVLLLACAIALAADDFQPPEIEVDVALRTKVYERCTASMISNVQTAVARYIGVQASTRYPFLRWREGTSKTPRLTLTIEDDHKNVVMRYSVSGEKDLTRQLFGASLATIKTAATSAECDQPTIEKDLKGGVDRVIEENGGNVFVEDLLRDVPLRRTMRLTPARSVVVPLYADCIHAAVGSLLRVSSTLGKERKKERLSWVLRPSDPWIDDDCYGCLETHGKVADSTGERDPADADWTRLKGRNTSDDYIFMSTYRLADRRQVDGRVLPRGVDCAK